jgi:hypothetical protein
MNPVQPRPTPSTDAPSNPVHPVYKDGVGVSGSGTTQTLDGVNSTTTTRTGYRCRDHHHVPVTWRGKGCPLCPQRGTKKPKTRKAPDTEWEWTQ